MARDCTTCKHPIFKEQMGEYKCKKKQRTVTLAEGRKCGEYERDKEKSRKLKK